MKMCSMTVSGFLSGILLVAVLGHAVARSTRAQTDMCEDNQFRCQLSHSCIPENWRCDDYEDCPNGEDERDCRCASDEFMCGDGECIPHEWRCDGDDDCDDASDEDARCANYVRHEASEEEEEEEEEQQVPSSHHGHGFHSNDHSGHQHFRHMRRKQLS